MFSPSKAESYSPNFKEILQNAAELQTGTDLQKRKLHCFTLDVDMGLSGFVLYPGKRSPALHKFLKNKRIEERDGWGKPVFLSRKG